jgi:hypothetical protein
MNYEQRTNPKNSSNFFGFALDFSTPHFHPDFEGGQISVQKVRIFDNFCKKMKKNEKKRKKVLIFAFSPFCT